jgi:hypothetical protein
MLYFFTVTNSSNVFGLLYFKVLNEGINMVRACMITWNIFVTTMRRIKIVEQCKYIDQRTVEKCARQTSVSVFSHVMHAPATTISSSIWGRSRIRITW